MAQVTGKTAAYMDGVVAETVKSGYVRSDNHLILVLHNDTEVDAGLITADAATLASAETYADGAAAAAASAAQSAAISAANSYTDTEVAALEGEIDANTLAISTLTTNLQGIELGDALNLNSITTPGVYHQSSSLRAGNGTNYPEGLAGMLEVFKNVGSNMIYQRYIPYGTNANRVWMRGYYNGTWYPWRVLRLGTQQTIHAYGVTSVTLSSAGSNFVQQDITAWGFTQPPSFAGVCHNFSYYAYRAGGGTHTNLTLPIGVRHYDNTSASTTVDVHWVAVGI